MFLHSIELVCISSWHLNIFVAKTEEMTKIREIVSDARKGGKTFFALKTFHIGTMLLLCSVRARQGRPMHQIASIKAEISQRKSRWKRTKRAFFLPPQLLLDY